jgi:crotonobetainyl-CoA:carnitine CoA-transferase CaiB-like acyl-CoA transferase
VRCAPPDLRRNGNVQPDIPKVNQAESNLPLQGLTAIDLTVNVPGPFCSSILSDLGARVIKVEPPNGDPLRPSPAMWASLNRGKQSIALDLKTDGGREVLHRLASKANVVLEGWRPGVAKRLAADYETLIGDSRGLVYCAISGFGQDGPWADRPAHDVDFLALAGYLDAQSQIEGRPWAPPVLISDLASAHYAAIAVLAALVQRASTGRGSYIDLSMADSTLALLAPEVGRVGTDEAAPVDAHEAAGKPNVTFIPHYGVFQCADDRWFSLGIVDEDHFWRRYCKAAGLGDLAGLTYAERVEGGTAITEAVAEAFMTRPATEWESILREADVPAAPVTALADLIDSPQFRARGMFPEIGASRFLAQPFKISGESIRPTRGAPGLGEHADALLAEHGYDAAEVGDLRRSGALGQADPGVAG